jgi:hypothetical protein
MSKKQTNKKPTSVNAKVKDYGDDPYFVKKAKESKAFLETHGFPKELITPNPSDRKKP